MTISSSSLPYATVVARLRAAGCVFAEEEAQLLRSAATDPAGLEAMIQSRVDGLPLEQILGWAEFCGLRIAVDPGVFVPRRRTEFLVWQAAALARPGALVVDLCCGSGAVGVALAATAGPIELHAGDIGPVAVACARRNLAGFGGLAYQGDLFAALPGALRGRVDLLVVNAPYVPTSEIALMPPEARDHEPKVALDGGPDGVDVHRRVAAEAARWLAPGGHVLIETSRRQAPSTARALAEGGLVPRIDADPDLQATVVTAAR